MFYRSHKKSSSRQFDYLYDPLYTTADYRDVQKKNAVALMRTAPLNLYTNYNDMFSDSPHRTQYFFVLQRNPLPRIPTFNASIVSHQPLVGKNVDTSASGRDRAKFFDFPSCAIKETATEPPECGDVGDDELKTMHGRKIKTIGCQTIYREQSAQTIPYFPTAQYECDDDQPEALMIADLIERNDIPGQYEADLVVRARKRRKWEKILQSIPTSTKIERNERRLILEAFEWENWLTQEEDIEKVQMERLNYVQQMLDERSKVNAAKSVGRLHVSIERAICDSERDIARIRSQHDRRVRKLRRSLIESVNKLKSSPNKNEVNISAFTKMPGHFEKFSSEFVSNEQPLNESRRNQSIPSEDRMTMSNRLRAAIEKIQTGLHKEHNYRLIYECLKAFRLKQIAYDHIDKLVKLLKLSKLSETDVEKCKKRLQNLVALLNKLAETVDRSEACPIDTELDLLSHKLNSVVHDGEFSKDDNIRSTTGLKIHHDETAIYLEDILIRCKTCSLPRVDPLTKSKSMELTKTILSSQEFIMNFIHEIVWPEIFKRLDRKKKRKQLMVDLKKLTSEERQMVEDIGKDCVESILDNSDPFE